MRGRRRAARLGRCILAAALALVPLAAEAADVAAMKVFGLALGDDRSTVAEAFPNMVFAEVDYADPVVGYTYEAALGRRAVIISTQRSRVQTGRGAEPDRVHPAADRRRPALRAHGVGALRSSRRLRQEDPRVDKDLRHAGRPGARRAGAVDRARYRRRAHARHPLLAEGRVAWQLIDARS